MSEAKEPIKNLSWQDLVAIRRYYADLYDECHDVYGIMKLDRVKSSIAWKTEVDRLDKYIQAKYEKIKSDSTKN